MKSVGNEKRWMFLPSMVNNYWLKETQQSPDKRQKAPLS